MVFGSLNVKLCYGLQDPWISPFQLLEDVVDRTKEDSVERRRRNYLDDGIVFVTIDEWVKFTVLILLEVSPVTFFVS